MIGINRDDINQIAQDFNDALTTFFEEEPDKGKSKLMKRIIKAQKDKDDKLAEMIEFYRNRRGDIAKIMSIKELYAINRKFHLQFLPEIHKWYHTPNSTQNKEEIIKSETQYGKFLDLMEYYYKKFMDSKISLGSTGNNFGMQLSKRLGIRTCPYCNRHYTFSVEKKNSHSGIRPQFDHFFPKSKYPITALCFFNLIPACPDCNNIKREKLLSVHPYEDSFDNKGIIFSYTRDDGNNLIVNISDTNIKNVKRLRLKELYQGHSDIVTDLINKAEVYTPDFIDSLTSSFSGLMLTNAEIERAIWGTSLDPNEMIDRPFSKLTRDILHQLGKI